VTPLTLSSPTLSEVARALDAVFARSSGAYGILIATPERIHSGGNRDSNPRSPVANGAAPGLKTNG
jgi:hypothetical protein